MPSLINPRVRNFIRNFIDTRGLLPERATRFTLHEYIHLDVLSSFCSFDVCAAILARDKRVHARVPGGSMKCTSDKRASRRWGSVSNANVENAIIDGFMLEKKKERKEKKELFSTSKWFEIKKRRENSVWNFYTVYVQLKNWFHSSLWSISNLVFWLSMSFSSSILLFFFR